MTQEKDGARRERRQGKKSNVLEFSPSASEQKERARPSHQEILDMMVELDDAEYESWRLLKSKEWKYRLPFLDRLRKAAVRIRAYKAKPQQPEPDLNDLGERLRDILDAENVLDLWIEDWDKVMAGEHDSAKLLYLVATSRLFDRGMHAAIKGPSGGGKSWIRGAVLRFIPDEDIVSFTAISEKALFFDPRDYRHKILSMDEASGHQELRLQDQLVRVLMSEGAITYDVPFKDNDGEIRTRSVTKEGPVVFMVTTTKAALFHENETRVLSIEIDDSKEQTGRVLGKSASTIGMNAVPDEKLYHRWQDFQKMLRIIGNKRGGWSVVIPFADDLAHLIRHKEAVRLRRDFVQILLAIKAHAVIHSHQRRKNEKNEVIADLDLDYAPVAKLMGNIVAEASGIAVRERMEQTIAAVKELTRDLAFDDGTTADKVGKALELDTSTAMRRLRSAAHRGFVTNLERRMGQPGKWRLTDKAIEHEALLPTVDEIRMYQSPR